MVFGRKKLKKNECIKILPSDFTIPEDSAHKSNKPSLQQYHNYQTQDLHKRNASMQAMRVLF